MHELVAPLFQNPASELSRGFERSERVAERSERAHEAPPRAARLREFGEDRSSHERVELLFPRILRRGVHLVVPAKRIKQ